MGYTIVKWNLLIGLFLVFIGCSGQEKDIIPVFKVEDMVSGGSININELIDSIMVIPLETTEKSLLPGDFKIWRGEKYILTLARDMVLQFSLDGRFIRELARRGRAPGEYLARASYAVDEKKERLYISDWNGKVMQYALDTGEFIDSKPWDYGVMVEAFFSREGRLVYIPYLNTEDSARYDVCQTTWEGEWLSGVKALPRSGENKTGSNYLREVNGELHFMGEYADTMYIIRDSVKIPAFFIEIPNRYTFAKGGGKIMQLEIETGNLLLLRIFDQKIELVEGGREVTLRNRREYLINKKEGTAKRLDNYNMIYTDVFVGKISVPDLFQSGDYISGSISATQLHSMKIPRKLNSREEEQLRQLFQKVQEDDNPCIITGKIRS